MSSYYEQHREERLAYYHANRDERLAYGRKWRAANPDYMREYAKKQTVEDVTYLRGIKDARGCADCGAHPGDLAQLHFHHLDPTTKTRPVAALVGKGRRRLDAEIAKCVVLCHGCHVERHRKMRQAA